MGQGQSLLQRHGYTFEKQTENGLIAIKDDERFLITKQISENLRILDEVEILKEAQHPHTISIKDFICYTLQDKSDQLTTFYVVTKYCEGGNLANKIRRKSNEESEALDWIAEICVALKVIHEKNILHENVIPQNIFFTEFGKLCLGGFWKAKESSKDAQDIRYLAPEVFRNRNYDEKSEIWSLGCILYELCTQKQAFSATTTANLVSKILCGPTPCLDDEKYSSQFHKLLSDMLNKDPASRPTAGDILGRAIILKSLLKKSKTTVEFLQTQLAKLEEVAGSLEQVHKGTTIASLTGGVIGAAGGITTIVGLILAPFTLGASLIVTGIGVGVGAVGGVTAGASNVTNMVNQSSNRQAVKNILKEFDEKINAVNIWLTEICQRLEILRERLSSQPPSEDSSSNMGQQADSSNMGQQAGGAARLGKGLGTAAELARHLSVANMGRIAAQASRSVRVAEAATGVLSGLFLAFDVVFIAMDAREIHRIRQTQADGETSSEILKFVQSVRKAAKELQEILDGFMDTVSEVKFLEQLSK
ncbi:calcium/calmodulin-dependent protein kinase type 1D-like [Xyrichtys novacula]|uniref:non-specific serine/threonine protein kinase n=1 Tax=Xyrichtys novacula TaxID=13765 RepID=A0AAV1FRE2_XYRNO|nr:calcium/calmodulin-dependent protein kinase type 1D-like [Xyrichtys novacula]